MSFFVVIEGLDGSGTTTQAEHLAAYLRGTGREVISTHEPTDGPVGRLIRNVLTSKEGAAKERSLPWLFAADRADHLDREIEPALNSGKWVVCDRYYHSSLAYQSMSLPLERVMSLNTSFRVPDLVFFLQVPVDVCMHRIAARGGNREIFEKHDQLLEVSDRYDDVISLLGSLGEPIIVLDGSAAPSDLAEVIAELLEENLG